MWQYNPVSNSWLQKNDFPAMARAGAVAFVINSKAYVSTGYDGQNYLNDLWEYDSVSDRWIQKASLPNGERSNAVSFAIQGKGYLATGNLGFLGFKNDLWEYDPLQDKWLQKADFLGGERISAAVFVIDDKGYISTGSFTSDLWEYDASLDKWTQKASLNNDGITQAVGFAINNKGYVALGVSSNNEKTVWEYTNSLNQTLDEGIQILTNRNRDFQLKLDLPLHGELQVRIYDYKGSHLLTRRFLKQSTQHFERLPVSSYPAQAMVVQVIFEKDKVTRRIYHP